MPQPDLGHIKTHLLLDAEFLCAITAIIFMDEPTSGLDARAAAVVMRTVSCLLFPKLSDDLSMQMSLAMRLFPRPAFDDCSAGHSCVT